MSSKTKFIVQELSISIPTSQGILCEGKNDRSVLWGVHSD